MRIRVEVYGLLRELMGWKSLDFELDKGSTLELLLEAIVRKEPKVRDFVLEGSEIKDFVKILVNGRDCRFLRGLRTRLEDGDVVSIFPPAGGG